MERPSRKEGNALCLVRGTQFGIEQAVGIGWRNSFLDLDLRRRSLSPVRVPRVDGHGVRNAAWFVPGCRSGGTGTGDVAMISSTEGVWIASEAAERDFHEFEHGPSLSRDLPSTAYAFDQPL